MTTGPEEQSKSLSGKKPSFRSFRTSDFKKQFSRLPSAVLEAAAGQYRIFLANPTHPLLRRHPLYDVDDAPENSFAVTMAPGGYRAVAFMDGEDYVWYWCGSHASYDTRFREGR